MYTIIILNSNASELIYDYKFLFKPFVEKGDIGFCNWDESGTELKTSVPDLYNLIKRKKEWRAIVVNLDSMFGYQNKIKPDDRNVFDYSEYDEDTDPHVSPVPMIRLTHMLGGYNENPVKEFEKGFQFYDPEIDETVRVRESELSEEQIHNMEDIYEDIIPVYFEKKVDPAVQEKIKELNDKYKFDESRPLDITLVATRRKKEEDDKQRIKNSWKNYLELSASNFCEKNNYPNCTRFICYDIMNCDNSLFRQELTEFWLSVLTLSINHIPASSLQAYRLYRMRLDLDEESLTNYLNLHINRLQNAYASIKFQMQFKPEYSFEEDEELMVEQPVPVIVEMDDSHSLFIKTKKIGLGSDCPENETVFWRHEFNDKKRKLDEYLKKPRRSLDVAARELKRKAHSFEDEKYVLDEFQKEDLTSQMFDLEKEIISSEIQSLLNTNQIKEELDDVNSDVRKKLPYRMSRNFIIASGLFALFAAFIGLLPYIVISFTKGIEEFLCSLLLSLIVMIVLSLCGILALLIQRSDIRSVMEEFNNCMREVVDDVNNYAEEFTEYFTKMCTYMKAQSIIDGVQKKDDYQEDRGSLLKIHQKAILTSLERDEAWMSMFDLSRRDELALGNVTSYFNVDEMPLNNSLYYFGINHEEDNIALNDFGEMISSPYSFISRLWIEREDIYDEEEEE